MTKELPYVDDHGNPPAVRRRHVCTKHGVAYCKRRKCKRQIKKTVKAWRRK